MGIIASPEWDACDTVRVMSSKRIVWRLRAGADKRFRSGHPWVYSNELQESPKGTDPGAPVELQDAGGKFLARGYGNPHSLIAFRAVSRDPAVEDPLSEERLAELLNGAASMRESVGLGQVSHRLCFGENDGIPGLVIDRFWLASGQVFSVQAHTAGADRLLEKLPRILESAANGPFAIVIRNDLSVRKLEGLEPQEPRLARELAGVDLSRAKIRVPSASGAAGAWLEMEADLLQGQKTGFFLDQSANIQLAALRLRALKPRHGRELRVLDLCCYAGQWSAQLAKLLKDQGVPAKFTAVDASAPALELARRNIEAQGGACETLKKDVLVDLGDLPDRSFDVVICDPPALIKGRKDIPAGTHAYLQLNTQVFRLAAPGAFVISCSCSSLLEEEELVRVLSKAAYRNKRVVRWVGRGGQAPDHPVLAEFPEGRYLKCWIGYVHG